MYVKVDKRPAWGGTHDSFVFTVVDSVRVNGQPRHRRRAYLGAIALRKAGNDYEKPPPSDLNRFWASVYAAIEEELALGNPDYEDYLIQQINQRVPQLRL